MFQVGCLLIGVGFIFGLPYSVLGVGLLIVDGILESKKGRSK